MQPSTAAKTYKIDENHSNVRFWVRHLMISKVHGELSDITGTVEYDKDNPGHSKIDATIGVNSLTTKNDQRDAHLKSADFLEAEKYPTITFQSTSMIVEGTDSFNISGLLTIKGVTKTVTLSSEISLEVPNPYGGYKIGVSAKGVINREEFGITWNQALETGGIMVGNDIHFEIDLELDRPV